MALVSYAEAMTYMHDVLLRDTDQMSMRHGLEVRVPLLDHCLVEQLMNLPDSVKRAGPGPKPLLVESLGMKLPRECVQRPKRGFVLPFDVWLRGPLRPFCERHLGPDGLAARDICRSRALAETWTSFLSEKSCVSWSRVWALVALDAWMESTGVRA
jgi:asparagine synthase (glutamine-hydrolysing)